MKVIDTGELQRLRQIKQLSFAHLKHHGATHDRFSHSLGVALLADKLAQTNSHFPELQSDTNLHLAYTLAALIHDIGHGPYGHTMDLVRRELGDTDGHEDDTGRIYEQIFSSDNSFADLDLALDEVAVAELAATQAEDAIPARLAITRQEGQRGDRPRVHDCDAGG